MRVHFKLCLDTIKANSLLVMLVHRLIVRSIPTDPIVPFAIMATGVQLELKDASPASMKHLP